MKNLLNCWVVVNMLIIFFVFQKVKLNVLCVVDKILFNAIFEIKQINKAILMWNELIFNICKQ